jgi:uncharacterized protein (DUF433 family)
VADKPITVDPDRCFGRPTITGTRIRTDSIADQFMGGDSVDVLMGWFDLTRAQVETALRYEMETPARKRKMEDRQT